MARIISCERLFAHRRGARKEMARRKGRSGGPKEGIRRSGLGPPAAFERRQLQGSRRRGTFSPAACSIPTTLEPLMFDTWASYESTRAFVTSSFLLTAPRQAQGTRASARLRLAAATIGQARDARRALIAHTPPSPPGKASPERGRPLAKLLNGKQSEVIECWYLLIERKSMAEKSGCTQIIIIALGICLGLALFGLCG